MAAADEGSRRRSYWNNLRCSALIVGGAGYRVILSARVFAMRAKYLLAGSAIALLCMPTLAFGAPASEQSYIERFGGTWAGPATVVKDSISWQVGCQVDGSASTDHIRIAGDCRLLVITVPIAADITYDRTTGRYSGTYIGSDVGAARVSGRRRGSLVDLVITWPKVINGDDRARMTIENAGGGHLSISTFDNVVVGGPEIRTSAAVLTLKPTSLSAADLSQTK